ncbi:MAG TPA: ABC transporter permease [Myxococcota bacterium]|nr:ABC transporter permease [Myxococcota bacterium]
MAIARKEVRQLRRDRLTFGMIVGLPVLQLLLFGYAINQDVRHLRAGVADLSGTQRARILVQDAQATQVVEIVKHARSAAELEALLREGAISVGLLVPPDFERRVESGARAPAQLLVDGSDPIVLAASRGIIELPVRPRSPAARASSPTFEVRAYYNPERRSQVQIVPGLMGVILTMTMVLFTAVAIVRERERGNLELLINTPVRTPELMVGKILPYMAIGMVQVTLILLVGRWLFDVPIRGSLVDVYVAGLVFVTTSLTLGLFISTLAATQVQAFQITFFTFLPQILLSGFMFPFDGMPRAAQWIAEVFPLTHFVRITRGILLRAATLSEVRAEVWPLLAFLAVAMAASIARFRKRLD